MTIPAGTRRMPPYAGDGSTTDFAVTFYVPTTDSITVIEVDDVTEAQSVKILDTDYTISNLGVEAGSTVSFLTAPESGKSIYIIGDMPLTQPSDFKNQSSYQGIKHEKGFDRAAIHVQELANKALQATDLVTLNYDAQGRDIEDIGSAYADALYIGGVPVVPDGMAFSLPDPAGNPNEFLVVNAAGTAYELKTHAQQDVAKQSEIASGAAGAVIFVDTVAGMKALTGLVDGATASTSGHTNEGVGSGEYIYDSALGSFNKVTTVASTALSGGFRLKTNGWVNVAQAGAIEGADATTQIQDTLNAAKFVIIDGVYNLSDKLSLSSDHTIYMTARTRITQLTADKQIFYALQKDSVTLACNGAILIGEGTWSAGWTGNSNHFDHGIELLGCTKVRVFDPHCRNNGHAGIVIGGGADIRIVRPTIEGTHAYSTPLPSGANFQNGVWIYDHATYGKAEDIFIEAPDISGCAQGVLRENYGTASLADVTLSIPDAKIHDIPGQHAFYIQGGMCTAENATLTNIELSGFKVQSADANQDIRGYKFSGTAYNVKSNLVDLATLGTGSVQSVEFNVVGDAIGTCVAINGDVRTVTGTVTASNSDDYLAYIFGDGPTGIDLTLNGDVVGQDGVLITATNADIKLRPRIRNANANNAGGAISGIRVESATATVEIYDPDVHDSGSKMNYGLFNSIAGGIVKVRGSARFTGAIDTAVRSTGVIEEWPSEVTLSGTNGAFTSTANVRSTQTMRFTANSTSASNVVLWQQTLPDESATLVEIELIGKLANSSERRAVKAAGLFYRDGGGIVTIQGAVDVDVDIASAGFAGVYSLASNGATEVALQVNSAGVATYNWLVNVKSTRLT